MSNRLRAWRARLAIWLVILVLVGLAGWMLTRQESQKEDLAIAARDGHTEVVKKLLASGANVNMKTKDGSTPLINASLNGHTEVVKALLGAGADINAKDMASRTALLQAARYVHIETMEALIAAGADVNAKNNDGRTAVIYAAMR